MSKIISVSAVDLPYRVKQSELKEFAGKVFSGVFDDIDRMLVSFDNAQIEYRNLCVPVEYFLSPKSFEEKNHLYIKKALEFSVGAVEECLKNAGIDRKSLTDLVFISTTGISTPSIDALIINEMKLDPNINRWPVWGLGCAGGAAGISKANVIAKANPDAIVMLLAVELCSLTFIRNDLSKSNFIATGLFSDGIGAVLVTGNNFRKTEQWDLEIVDSLSRLYYDSLDVMGWEIENEGFRVVFSKNIPLIVSNCVKHDIESFLKKHKLKTSDIQNYIMHPGGVKVIDAYTDALNICPEKLNNTRKVLREYGNMSSASIIYVIKEFMKGKLHGGYGIVMSLGPGFSSEMVLIKY